MIIKTILCSLLLLCFAAEAAQTVVAIKGDQFYINGKPTYKGRSWNGHKIEGLLINSRMVQGIFDDLNPGTATEFAYPDTKKWDADRNTNEFVAAMPVWYSHGMNAFTLNMQGGSPYGYGNKKCLNPGFNADGSLMEPYMKRLDRILTKADELHMVVILGIFYFGQDQHLKDEQAIINATDNLVNWLFDRKYRNVIIEIANETNTRGNYDHKILWPDRIHELIERVKSKQKNGYRFLVGTSYEGRVVPTSNVVKASDLILIHGNGAKQPEQIQTLIDATKKVEGYRKMPIVNNEDDHFDFDKETNNFTVSVKNYVSWGYFDFRFPGETDYREGYQSVPVDWGINSDRKRGFFQKVKEITSGHATTKGFEKSRIERSMLRALAWQEANAIFSKAPTDWTNGAYYTGVVKAHQNTRNKAFLDALTAMATRNNWQPYERFFHADDLAICNSYLYLNTIGQSGVNLAPTDTIIKNHLYKPHPWREGIPDKDQRILWWWCDALFMTPPVLSAYAKLKNDPTYLSEMDRYYKQTYDLLYNKEEKLFARDVRFLWTGKETDMKEKSGKRVFWSRGNGWVLGGLALTLENMPKTYKNRPFYVNLYKEMAARIKDLQPADGLWRTSLLSPESFAHGEVSGSGFFTFGLAWGINNGLLDKKTYQPVVLKAWDALTQCQQESGKIGWVQNIGFDPKPADKDSWQNFGTGAYLLAGSEILKLK